MVAPLAARVVEHQAHIFRKFWRGSAFAYVLNPVLFLAAIGLGVGGLVKQGNGTVEGISYLAFVAPGLMGWAQLKHDRHPHHSTDTAETIAKLSYDLYYLKHRSLYLDVLIMLQTVPIILTAKGT